MHTHTHSITLYSKCTRYVVRIHVSSSSRIDSLSAFTSHSIRTKMLVRHTICYYIFSFFLSISNVILYLDIWYFSITIISPSSSSISCSLQSYFARFYLHSIQLRFNEIESAYICIHTTKRHTYCTYAMNCCWHASSLVLIVMCSMCCT